MKIRPSWQSFIIASLFVLPTAYADQNQQPVSNDLPETSVAAETKAAMTANLVGFESWAYGMTIDEAKRIAADKKLPMSAGRQLNAMKFSEEEINKQPDARIYTYATTVNGQYALAQLHFTNKTKELFAIETDIVAPTRSRSDKARFQQLITDKLNLDYGASHPTANYLTTNPNASALLLDDAFYKQKIWVGKQNKVVTLTSNKRSFNLTYQDLVLSEQAKLN